MISFLDTLFYLLQTSSSDSSTVEEKELFFLLNTGDVTSTLPFRGTGGSSKPFPPRGAGLDMDTSKNKRQNMNTLLFQQIDFMFSK